MVAKQILSVQHPFVKHCVALRLERAAREEHRSVLVVGEIMVRERAELTTLITTTERRDLLAQEQYVVSEEVLKKITGVPAPDGFAAVVPLPELRPLTAVPRLLVLDRIADPGNLGTLLRAALALGWDAVAMTPGCVDPFNDKALRASRGAPFLLPMSVASPEEIAQLSTTFVVADMEGTPLRELSVRPPLALVLSNESEGVAPWAQRLGIKVSIPMRSGVESLNVAVSGGIFLYTLGVS